jgi:sugar O-acyltransferase (sialic acid O-acetyltransferase NeuD family)
MDIIILGANNPQTIRLINDINSNKNYLDDKINVLGWIDNDVTKVGQTIFGYKVLGTPDILSDNKFKSVFLVNNITRDGLVRKLTTEQLLIFKLPFISLVHPSVNIENVKIGRGVIVHEGVIIEDSCIIDDYVAIAAKTSIAHESYIGKYSFLATNVTTAGLVEIGESVTIWTSATITPRIKIGDRVKVGAGSVVLSNIEADKTVFGNPARVLISK